MSKSAVTSSPRASHPSRRRAAHPARHVANMLALLAKRSPRAAEAIVTIVEIMADSDRMRAKRLIEAIATLVEFAPHHADRGARP
jgi:hypothetical protein